MAFTAQSILQSWKLSHAVILILGEDPETVMRLAKERNKSTFPSQYVPTEIQVLYDHELYIRVQQGQITHLRHCSLKYIPTFVEVQFDQELAMFLVKGEMIVDRTSNACTLTQLIKQLEAMNHSA